MFDVAPSELVDSRKQIHWAAQLLAATADAKLKKTRDDSHSNLCWDAATQCLKGRVGISLDVPKLTLRVGQSSFSLNARTLEDAANWLRTEMDTTIKFREYKMPAHEVGQGGSFSHNATHQAAIARWLTFGQTALSGNGELRVWPHHFDLGFWKPGESAAQSIGGGFSLGDNYYEQPYFYINPYGIERPETLPDLKFGHWTSHWTGAVLTAEDLAKCDPPLIARQFVQNLMQISSELLQDNN